MGSLKNPKTWIPYINPKDCSKRICNIQCTQWCNYIILPSPPPPPAAFSGGDLGGTTLSPLVIAIIAILGSIVLLVGYFIIISRYCFVNPNSSQSSENQETLDLEMEEVDYNDENNTLNHVPWLVSGKGLDEALIKSIRVCKYKRGDGLVSCTDCSVCLGEFQENESIRVLPKCSHAFHVYCIDTWLKTHSNCPLCRANICCVNTLPIILPPPPPPLPETLENNEFSSDSRHGRNFSRRVSSDLGGRNYIIEIREDGDRREIKRSLSTSNLCQKSGFQ